MMIVFLMWSLCELLISPPCILGDEAPHKMPEPLINRVRTRWQVTYSEPNDPTYSVHSTRVDGGLVAPLFDFISTNDQWLKDVDSSGRWQVAWALLYITYSSPKDFPMSLGKIYTCPLSIRQLTKLERVVIASTRLRYDNGWPKVGCAGWNMMHDPLCFAIVSSKTKREWSHGWELGAWRCLNFEQGVPTGKFRDTILGGRGVQQGP